MQKASFIRNAKSCSTAGEGHNSALQLSVFAAPLSPAFVKLGEETGAVIVLSAPVRTPTARQ